jgi:hypothetical protein
MGMPSGTPESEEIENLREYPTVRYTVTVETYRRASSQTRTERPRSRRFLAA